MNRHITDQILDLRSSAEGVGHVARGDRSPDQLDELVSGMRRIDTHRDPTEPCPPVFASGSDAHLAQPDTSLHRNVGHRQGEAGCHRRQQQLAGLHAGVGTAASLRLIHRQRELADLHRAAVAARPARRHLHGDRVI